MHIHRHKQTEGEVVSPILVSKQKSMSTNGLEKPAHWADAKGSAFVNPWPSFRFHGFLAMMNLVSKSMGMPTAPKDIRQLLPIHKPTWGAGLQQTENKIIATWLGHACFLIELPKRSNEVSRGVRVLFDPVWSDRCSPSQLAGPKRYSPPPCKVEDIPDIDVIVISHNHYDHMDTHTLKSLFGRQRKPHIFAPLGNEPYFRSLSIPESHSHTLDWWDTSRVEVAIPVISAASSTTDDATTEPSLAVQKLSVDVTCTPAQHFTGRGAFDRFKTLWASWAVAEVLPEGGEAKKVWFGGDTGYRTVKDGEDEDEVPVCPAFKEIGERFGGFDLALIPIGAYNPRQYMSPVHCAPQDSVRIFKDIKAKTAVGMHWGTWIMTWEEAMEPPKVLKEECKKQGVDVDAFKICDIGESLLF